MYQIKVLVGDCVDVLKELEPQSVQCVVTSPPYWGLRKYGGDGDMIGMEPSFDDHVKNLRAVFREVWRVLKDDGTLWLNYGDAYVGGHRRATESIEGRLQGSNKGSVGFTFSKNVPDLKPKDLIMMPFHVAVALQQDGWYVRSEIIWHKTAVMPESVKDRPTCAHEKIFLMSKNRRYFYNRDAVAQNAKDPGKIRKIKTKEKYTDKEYRLRTGIPGGPFNPCRVQKGKVNLRNVWSVGPSGSKLPHFAVMPEQVIRPCILAGSRIGDTVLDPFGGVGSVPMAANKLQRHAIMIEINQEYANLAEQRFYSDSPLFADIQK